MTLLKYKLIVLILFFSMVGLGQKAKQSTGYYLTQEGDSVNCIFLPRNWKKQPVEVKVTVNAKEQKLTAENSKGFYLKETDTWFESIKIGPALYEQQMQFANNHYTPEYDSARLVFAKRLFKYDLSLWLYIDPVERKHFFVATKDQYIEIYKHIYSAAGGFHTKDPIVTWYNQYIYTLKTHMIDCQSLFPIIDAIDLKETDLIKLLILYKTCKEAKNEK